MRGYTRERGHVLREAAALVRGHHLIALRSERPEDFLEELAASNDYMVEHGFAHTPPPPSRRHWSFWIVAALALLLCLYFFDTHDWIVAGTVAFVAYIWDTERPRGGVIPTRVAEPRVELSRPPEGDTAPPEGADVSTTGDGVVVDLFRHRDGGRSWDRT